jgi:acetolactate synthase small subunit
LDPEATLIVQRKNTCPISTERVTFVIDAQNQGDVLPRVVLIFHRLNVEIEWMHLTRRRGSEMMRLSIRVMAESEHACRLEAQLYKVVQVTSVRIKMGRTETAEKPILSSLVRASN